MAEMELSIVKALALLIVLSMGCLCSREGDEGKYRFVELTSLQIVGTASGGTFSVGIIGFEHAITIQTTQGQTAEQIAQALIAAPEPKATSVKASNTASIVMLSHASPANVFVYTTDVGLRSIECVTNLRAVSSKQNNRITLTWTLPKSPPDVIYLHTGYDGVKILPGNTTSYVDTVAPASFFKGQKTGYIITSAKKNAAGVPTQFSDKVAVTTEVPGGKIDDQFKILENIFTKGGHLAVKGEPFDDVVLKEGGVDKVVYSIQDGALPGGLTLNSATGKISGTPTVFGNFTFTVKVTDAEGNVVTKAIQLEVLEVPPPSPVVKRRQNP